MTSMAASPQVCPAAPRPRPTAAPFELPTDFSLADDSQIVSSPIVGPDFEGKIPKIPSRAPTLLSFVRSLPARHNPRPANQRDSMALYVTPKCSVPNKLASVIPSASASTVLRGAVSPPLSSATAYSCFQGADTRSLCSVASDEDEEPALV